MKTIQSTTDIFINQGKTFQMEVSLPGANTYEFIGVIRRHQDADVEDFFSITSSEDMVFISMSEDQTLALKPKTYIFEIMKKKSGIVSILSEGNAIVSPGVAFVSEE